jgi:hypothetical protein
MEWDRKQVWSSAYGAAYARLIIDSKHEGIEELSPAERYKRYDQLVDGAVAVADMAVSSLESRDRIASIEREYVEACEQVDRYRCPKCKGYRCDPTDVCAYCQAEEWSEGNC